MGWWEGRASRPGEAATTEPSLSTHGHAYFHPGRCVGLAPRASEFAPCWIPRYGCVHVGVGVDVDVDVDVEIVRDQANASGLSPVRVLDLLAFRLAARVVKALVCEDGASIPLPAEQTSELL